jgi:hypothetical protein
MKFRITEGRNNYDGSPMFYAYELTASNAAVFVFGSSKEEEVRAFVDRRLHSIERVVAEIES